MGLFWIGLLVGLVPYIGGEDDEKGVPLYLC